MRLLTISLFTALLSVPAYAADLGTYRPGTPYSTTIAQGADICDNQCTGDAQCRGWNYVKPNPKAQGVCEFLSTVSSPISSQISISGESASATRVSPRLQVGSTNTIRVGTAPTPRTNTVKIGQSSSGRRIVRESVPQRVAPQQTAVRPIQDMSLTAQQNRYRQGQVMPQKAQPRGQHVSPRTGYQGRPHPQQPRFRPILDEASPYKAHTPQRPARRLPQSQIIPQRQQINPSNPRATQRRTTGPRRTPAQQNRALPPIQNRPAAAVPPYSQQQARSQAQPSGRPPVGQPIRSQHNSVPRVTDITAQRLAQLKAQTAAQVPIQVQAQPQSGPVALNPEQAKRSLFGRLHDDVKIPESTPQDMPIVTALPTQPIKQEPLETLAGGR